MMNTLKEKKRALVAMSGGVDSSVSALLLKDQGYEVIGVTMQVWDYSAKDCEEGFGTCCSSVDVEDARKVAYKLGIPFYVINCEHEFKQKVIDPFLSSYQKGQTPIPCLNCNTYLKFDYLIQKMKELECDYLATGHYAVVKQNKNRQWMIYQSEDSWKDQTYFLFTIQPEILPRLLFPVGGMKKEKIREIAKEKNLPVFNKKDSTGLCFIGKKGYVKFIEDSRSSFQKGHLKSYPSGEILGEHSGIHRFTYGQRKRLGVPSNKPLYVIRIDPSSLDVWLGEEKYLYKSQVQVCDLYWLDRIQNGERLKIKIRFQHESDWARVYLEEGGHCSIKFEKAQRACTPGQSAVIYREKQLVGGGMIQSVV